MIFKKMLETASESLCKSKDVCNDVKEYIIEEEDEAATVILTERLQERSLHMQSIGIKFFKTKWLCRTCLILIALKKL